MQKEAVGKNRLRANGTCIEHLCLFSFFFFPVTKKNVKLVILNDLSLTVLGLIIASLNNIWYGANEMIWYNS